MRYLISEVEFYLPTIEQFKKNVVVVRRDQLEGEKLYIAPRELLDVSASFSGDENSIDIPMFADIIMYLKAINSSFSLSEDKRTIYISVDSDSMAITDIGDNRLLMEVAEFNANGRSLYDFLDGLDLHIMVATTLPRTVDLNSEEEVAPEETKEDSTEEIGNPATVSDEEAEAIINDSNEEKEEPKK